MPIYDLKCKECGELTEQFTHSFLNILTECPHCGGGLSQTFSPAELYWKTGKSTISFGSRRKYTQPHKSHDARHRDYMMPGDSRVNQF